MCSKPQPTRSKRDPAEVPFPQFLHDYQRPKPRRRCRFYTQEATLKRLRDPRLPKPRISLLCRWQRSRAQSGMRSYSSNPKPSQPQPPQLSCLPAAVTNLSPQVREATLASTDKLRKFAIETVTCRWRLLLDHFGDTAQQSVEQC
eukprot:3420815-Pleurochrysis_carterae.AAC.1